jgi:hypothetical protein
MMKSVVRQVQDAKVNEETRRVKHHTCYTCREKGHFVRIVLQVTCPNQILSTMILLSLGGTCAIRVIDSPRISIRTIWIPNHLVTNLDGPNKIWLLKGSC